MATERQRMTLGYAGLGLLLGVVLFSFFYIITVRMHIAQRFTWTWVFIFILVLVGPALIGALIGSGKKSNPMAPR